MREEILRKLIDRTAKALNVDASTLNENTIVADLGLKSLEMAGIIASFEDDYDAYIKYINQSFKSYELKFMLIELLLYSLSPAA